MAAAHGAVHISLDKSDELLEQIRDLFPGRQASRLVIIRSSGIEPTPRDITFTKGWLNGNRMDFYLVEHDRD
uniref:Uncharacterized protein n=1 Tax=Tetranychus urticae TaxID=32264 RepID=T1KNR9_TETUR